MLQDKNSSLSGSIDNVIKTSGAHIPLSLRKELTQTASLSQSCLKLQISLLIEQNSCIVRLCRKGTRLQANVHKYSMSRLEIPSPAPAIWLHSEPESETQIPITRRTDKTTLGRHPECDICIESQFISRFHAELFFEAGAWWVKDLESANGVFVNSERISRAQLNDQSILKLGRRISFKVFVDKL